MASGQWTRKYNEDTFLKVSCKFYKTLIKKELDIVRWPCNSLIVFQYHVINSVLSINQTFSSESKGHKLLTIKILKEKEEDYFFISTLSGILQRQWHRNNQEGQRATFQGKETYFGFLYKLSTKWNIGQGNNQCWSALKWLLFKILEYECTMSKNFNLLTISRLEEERSQDQ